MIKRKCKRFSVDSNSIYTDDILDKHRYFVKNTQCKTYLG